ncbi:MAG: hypothetical protein AAF902_22775 [Chloroflexota bacterium]
MEKKEFYLNQDHRTISIIVPIFLLVFIVVGYRLFYRFLPSILGGQSSDYILIAGVFSIFASAFLLWVIDPLLKRFFPSGHKLDFDPNAGTLAHSFEEDVQIELSDQPNWQVIHWNFRMGRFVKSGRERQIPRGWYCMAMLLSSNAKELVVYSYMQPRKQRGLSVLADWEEISMYETIEDSGRGSRNLPVMRPPTVSDSIPGKLLVGEQGQIWLAERKRRDSGLEMTPKDFRQLCEYVSK